MTGLSKIKKILYDVFDRLYNLFGVDVVVSYYSPESDSYIDKVVSGVLFTERTVKEIESQISQTENPLIAIYSTSLQFVSREELPVESDITYTDQDTNKTYQYKIVKRTPIGFPGVLYSYELKEVQ